MPCARDAAVFEASRLEGSCLDVEAQVAARERGLGIVEVPVTWRNDAATRVGLLKGACTFADLVGILVGGLVRLSPSGRVGRHGGYRVRRKVVCPSWRGRLRLPNR
jgi:hypothetical protein